MKKKAKKSEIERVDFNSKNPLDIYINSGNKANAKQIGSDYQKSSKDPFEIISEISNVAADEIKKECITFQARKLMSKFGKAIVRYDVSDKEVEKVFLRSSSLGIKEFLVSPIYIPLCAKIVRKHRLEHLHVGAIIDFPFGESDFKTKMFNVKECLKLGVDSITVTMPNMLSDARKIKIIKKQIHKISKRCSCPLGIAVNATDLDEQRIKHIAKLVDKMNVDFITLMFGDTDYSEIKKKLTVTQKYVGSKTLKVFGNVESVEAVKALFALNTDVIISPYSDELGNKIFNLLGLK